MTPFFVQTGPKKHFLRDFIPTFFQNYWIAAQVIDIISIESPNIFHWKSAKKSKVDVVFGAKFGSN